MLFTIIGYINIILFIINIFYIVFIIKKINNRQVLSFEKLINRNIDNLLTTLCSVDIVSDLFLDLKDTKKILINYIEDIINRDFYNSKKWKQINTVNKVNILLNHVSNELCNYINIYFEELDINYKIIYKNINNNGNFFIHNNYISEYDLSNNLIKNSIFDDDIIEDDKSDDDISDDVIKDKYYNEDINDSIFDDDTSDDDTWDDDTSDDDISDDDISDDDISDDTNIFIF